jgi:hypothetical protein
MLSNLQTYTIVGIAALIWLPLSLIGFVSGGPAAVLGLSDAVAVILLGVSGFERWGWRWRRLHPNLIGTPDIHGTWRGVMNSSYVIPTTGLVRPPRVVYLAIRQTLSTVWVRLLTDESQSDQMAGSIVKDRTSEDWLLSYSYRNTPRLPLRKASPEHRGAALLAVNGEPARRIWGEYWTSREASGTLDLDARDPAIAQTFADAEALFADRP